MMGTRAPARKLSGRKLRRSPNDNLWTLKYPHSYDWSPFRGQENSQSKMKWGPYGVPHPNWSADSFSNSLIGLSSFGKFIRPVTIIYWRYSSRQNVIFHCRKLTRKAHIQSRSLQAGIHLRRSFQCARSWRIPSSSSCLALSRGSPARRIGS